MVAKQQRRRPGVILLLSCCIISTCFAFAPQLQPSPSRVVAGRRLLAGISISSSSTALSSSSNGEATIIVISPPGGIGEITSVESAKSGGSVRWFVVSAPSSSGDGGGEKIALTSETLGAIERNGGSMELAGASADSLLSYNDDGGSGSGSSALAAMSSWLESSVPKSVICTYDGAIEERKRIDRSMTAEEREKKGGGGDVEEMIRSGVRLAAREAARAARGNGGGSKKIAILGAEEETTAMNGGGEENEEKKGGGGGLLGALFGGNDELEIPTSLVEAMDGATAIVRYGELFGAAESSVSLCSYFVMILSSLSHLVQNISHATQPTQPTNQYIHNNSRNHRLSWGDHVVIP